MSATDELRLSPRAELYRMLDESGIDHHQIQATMFLNCDDGRELLAYTYESDGKLKLAMKVVALTPAQATDATIGSIPYFWTADNVLHLQSRRMPTSVHVECGGEVVEMEPGRGACKNVHEPPKDGTFWPSPHFKCSECGATHVSMEYVYYCPNCGRVVEP